MPDLIPHIQQYLGVWSIEPTAGEKFRQMISGMDLSAHIREASSRMDEGDHDWSNRGYEVAPNGVAVIDLEGVLTKYGSSLSRGGSTVRFRRALRQAREDASIKSVMLVIESPGGTTMGTPEAAAEVAATAAVKPVHVYFEDIGASAAYWIGSQATKVIANAPAWVGSIGTYFTVYDVAGLFSKQGIKTHLFTTGEHKGAGTQGTPITEEQAAEFQSLVDRMNQPFVAAVQQARGLSAEQMSEITDGRVWRGDEAVAMGLIDQVMTYDEALAELTNSPGTPGSKPTSNTPASSGGTPLKGANAMAKPRVTASTPAKSEDEVKKEEETKNEDEVIDEEEDETKKDEAASRSNSTAGSAISGGSGGGGATIAQLKAALPEANSDFILSALEKGMGVSQARMSWLEQTVKSQQKQIETMQSQGAKPGVPPLGSNLNSEKNKNMGDAISAWKAAVKDCGGSICKARAAHPELHAAYLDAVNAKRTG